MTHLVLAMFGSEEVFSNFGLWVFLSVGAVALFAVFIPLVTWIEGRRKEREAFYKAETFRRLAESTGEGTKGAIELLRAESRQEQIKKREGMKIGGLICVAVGVAMVIFMRPMAATDPGVPYLIGLIPGFVGIAMLVYVFFLAAPVE
jgi:hypothetical protein